MTAADTPILSGLPPILDAEVETLMLGSFPSPVSLATGQYYAHRQNHFWRVLSVLLDEKLLEFDYRQKQCCLLRHRIGVWDVYRSCLREGALDSAIRTAEPNDFSALRNDVPRLQRVCFNGKTSGKSERWFAEQGYETFVLPSTSPAYTMVLAEKIERWRAAGIGTPPSR